MAIHKQINVLMYVPMEKNQVERNVLIFSSAHPHVNHAQKKNNPNACTSCPNSKFLKYNPFAALQNENTCALTTKNNAQHLLTINRNTRASTGLPLSEIFYKRNVI